MIDCVDVHRCIGPYRHLSGVSHVLPFTTDDRILHDAKVVGVVPVHDVLGPWVLSMEDDSLRVVGVIPPVIHEATHGVVVMRPVSTRVVRSHVS